MTFALPVTGAGWCTHDVGRFPVMCPAV